MPPLAAKSCDLIPTALAIFLLPTMGVSAAWQIVHHADKFDDAALGTDWIPVSGDWALENGRLVCRTGGLLAFAREVDGLQRIELVAGSNNPGDLSLLLHSDGDSIDTGYFLPFGGIGNQLNKGRRKQDFITYDDEVLIEPGKSHSLVAEFDGEVVRLEVDGKTVHRYVEELQPLLGEGHNRIAIYIYTDGWIESARILSQAPPEHSEELQNRARLFPEPSGSNLLAAADGEDPELFVRWGGFLRRNTDHAHTGTGSLELPAIGTTSAPGWVPIDRTKKYSLGGYFKSAQPGQPSRMLLDMRFYNADKEPIEGWMINPATDISLLLADAPVGSTRLLVAPGDWEIQPDREYQLALFAEENLSDLPNFALLEIARIEETGAGVEITLSTPLESALAKGTPVRLHQYLDHPRVYTNHVPEEWTHFEFQVADAPPEGGRPQDRIWPGAAYARVVIMNHYSKWPAPLPEGQPQPVLLFDDITFQIVK